MATAQEFFAKYFSIYASLVGCMIKVVAYKLFQQFEWSQRERERGGETELGHTSGIYAIYSMRN